MDLKNTASPKKQNWNTACMFGCRTASVLPSGCTEKIQITKEPRNNQKKKRSAATAPKLLKTDRHAAQGPKHMDTQMKCFLSHFNKVTLKNSTNTAVMTVVTY